MRALHDKLERVDGLDSFLEFVQALVEDRIEKAKDEASYTHGGQPDGWEHSKIEDYLAAALSWAESSRNLPTGMSSEASWKGFATFLYCGKIYE